MHVAEAFATGEYTLTAIQRKMFSIGLVSKDGKHLALSTVQKVLTNPFYYGHFRYRGEVHQGSHKPMISKKLFDQIQMALVQNGKPRKKRGPKNCQFLGFATCGECRYAITGRMGENGSGTSVVFHTHEDYRDFEFLLSEMKEIFDMRILAYVVMPNHWHLLLYPKKDGDVSRSMQWLGTSHARRHHTRKETVGAGHLYQGRYKSFLIEEDAHILTVLKYIERNPVRAKLVAMPDDWKWGSAHRRLRGTPIERLLLADPPVELPTSYRAWIFEPEPSEELEMIRESVNKGVPCGNVLPHSTRQTPENIGNITP